MDKKTAEYLLDRVQVALVPSTKKEVLADAQAAVRFLREGLVGPGDGTGTPATKPAATAGSGTRRGRRAVQPAAPAGDQAPPGATT